MTGPPTVDIHVDNRLTRTSCPLSPAFQHFSRKYQHPPTNIFDMAPHTPGVLRFGKLSKPVAPAGYKNKQCRKQTSVLSGRTMTAYVPLRSATERERAAFLIPCQGLRGYSLNCYLAGDFFRAFTTYTMAITTSAQ